MKVLLGETIISQIFGWGDGEILGRVTDGQTDKKSKKKRACHVLRKKQDWAAGEEKEKSGGPLKDGRG